MSLNRKLFSISASDAVCNSESLEPFGNEASYNKNVAVYQFEDNLNDSSGNGNNGADIVDSAVSYNASGKFGKAASFDGTNDAISIPAGLGTSGDRSRSFWVKISTMPASSTGDTIFYIGHGTDNSYYESFSVRETAGASTYKFRWDERHNTAASPTDNQKLSTATLTTGVWYHIVLVQEGTSRKMYINGSLDSTHTNANSVNNTAYLTSIGSWKFGDCCWYDGLIDQFRFYNDKALTAEEVTTLYVDETTDTASTTTIIPGTSCVAYYPLDYDAQDKSTNYDGTPTNVEFVQNGKINYSALFNGTASASRSKIVTSGLTTYNNFSISFWFKSDDVSATRLIMGTSDDYSSQTGFGVFNGFPSSGVLRWRVSDGSSTVELDYSGITTGRWYHVAITQNSSTNEKNLYLDGSSVATSTSSINATGQGYSLLIGGYSGYTSTPYDGDLDEVRIFNKALSASEVSTLAGLTACTQTCTTDTAGSPATTKAYYTLDSNVEDSSGNSYDGTATDITYAGGRFGSAASFNGSSSKILLPSDVGTIFQNNWSCSLWLQIDSLSTYRIVTGFWKSSTAYRWGLEFDQTDNKLKFFFYTGGASAVRSVSTTTLSVGTWYHVAATVSSTAGKKIFINGNLEHTLADTDNLTTDSTTGATYENWIGRSVWGGGDWWDGLIDQVKYFPSVLTDSQMQDLYDKEFQCYITKDASDPFGGSSEKAFYKFSEGSSTTVADSTGSLTGTANGMTWSSDAAIGSYSGDFDGSNDYLSHASPYSHTTNTEDVSISWWFNTDTTYASSGFDTMLGGDIANSSGNGGTVGINIYGHGTKVVYVSFTRIWGSSANYYPSASTSSAQHCTIEPGRWYHGVITYDPNTSSYGSSTSSFYLNGVKVYDVTMSTYTTSGNGTGATLAWGQYRASNTFYNGKLDHIRFYNTILTGEQVWKLYSERNN